MPVPSNVGGDDVVAFVFVIDGRGLGAAEAQHLCYTGGMPERRPAKSSTTPARGFIPPTHGGMNPRRSVVIVAMPRSALSRSFTYDTPRRTSTMAPNTINRTPMIPAGRIVPPRMVVGFRCRCCNPGINRRANEDLIPWI